MKMSSGKQAARFGLSFRGLYPGPSIFGALLAAFAAQQAVGQTGAQPPPHSGPAGSANQETEIALALSACPPAVAKGAAVYVLGKSGYVKVRDSHNGFTAIVQRSVAGAQEPQCMDAEGAQSWLRRILMVAELRAAGKGREEVQHLVADAVAKGMLKPPRRPGIIYMLSTQNRPPNFKGEVTPFPPHVMLYAPYLANADIGVDGSKLGTDGNPEGPVFVAGENSPYALLIVPVGNHDAMTHTTQDFGSIGGALH
jgi:hypothetical protein